MAGINQEGWLYLYHGMRADDETGLYNSAGKAYDPFTSRVLDWHQHQYFLHSSSFEFPPEAYDPHMEAFDADPYHLYAGLGWAGSALLAVGTGGLSLTVEGVLVFSLEQGLMRAAEAALIGGVIGGVDSWLHVDANGQHGDFLEGAFSGSQFAMRLSGVASGLGALGVSAQALWGLGVAANVGLTGIGAYDSFSQDQRAQGLFRVGVGLAFGMQQFGAARSGSRTGVLAAAEEGISVEDGMARVNELRTSLNIGAGKNIAIADSNINGVSNSVAATSGAYCPPGTLQMPANRMFQTMEVSGFSRALDSEVFILENAAQGLDQNASGSINLFSERPVCDSCQSVISQFRQAFPKIKVNVNSGGGN